MTPSIEWPEWFCHKSYALAMDPNAFLRLKWSIEQKSEATIEFRVKKEKKTVLSATGHSQ